MRVRAYLVLLISVAALGACALVGGLALSFQDLEREQMNRAKSAEALRELGYVKEDLKRLTTLGDLVFGASQGLNTYIARPVLSQLTQVEGKLSKISAQVTLDQTQHQQVTASLSALRSLFEVIHKGELQGDEYDLYDERSFQLVQQFQALFKASRDTDSEAADRLTRQHDQLELLALTLSLAYLALISLLTWWADRALSRPIASLSASAASALDEGEGFAKASAGPLELKALSEVLFRLINQLEIEVQKKTEDLEEENKVRRAAEAKLRLLNERQRALVEASVRFVPRPFLEFLGRSDLTLIQRGDSTRQHLGILFSDLRGFTSLAETREPQEIFDLLNRYLDAVVPSIHKNLGFVDKYIGDAIMALFPHRAERAVQAAVEMFHALYTFTEHDDVPLQMGIGIHWGEVVLGTLGSTDRWESTVIGDTVNLAARLEGMTKAYSCPLIISDALVSALPSDHPYLLRPLELVRVKGRTTPVTIYEVINAHPEATRTERLSTLDQMKIAFERYKIGDIEAALVQLREAQVCCPLDPLPKLLIERCEDLQKKGLPEHWSGVYQHAQK